MRAYSLESLEGRPLLPNTRLRGLITRYLWKQAVLLMVGPQEYAQDRGGRRGTLTSDPLSSLLPLLLTTEEYWIASQTRSLARNVGMEWPFLSEPSPSLSPSLSLHGGPFSAA